MLICGGVIPQEDYEFLYDAGCTLIFGPGTKITDASNKIISMLEKK